MPLDDLPDLSEYEVKPKTRADLSVPAVVDGELAKLGWSDNARLSLLGDLGRENAWNRNTIFGGHIDPASNTGGRGVIQNRGIISWNGDRRTKLDNYLKQQGVYGKSNDDELRGMARFMDQEMASNPEWQGIHKKMRDPNISTYDASENLRKYIKYNPGGGYNSPDPNFRVKNNAAWASKAKAAGLGPLPDISAYEVNGLPDLSAYEVQPTQAPPVVPGQTPAAPVQDVASPVLSPTQPAAPIGTTPSAPVPESPQTLEAQVVATRDQNSTKAAVLLTPQEAKLQDPASLAGLLRRPMPDGRILYVNGPKAKAMGVTNYVRDMPKLLGKVTPVADTSQGTAVVSTLQNGKEANTSVVSPPTPGNIQDQAAVDQSQFPGQIAKQEVMPTQDAAAKRLVPDRDLVLQWAQQSGKEPYQALIDVRGDNADTIRQYSQYLKQRNTQHSPENFAKFQDAMRSQWANKAAPAISAAVSQLSPIATAAKAGKRFRMQYETGLGEEVPEEGAPPPQPKRQVSVKGQENAFQPNGVLTLQDGSQLKNLGKAEEGDYYRFQDKDRETYLVDSKTGETKDDSLKAVADKIPINLIPRSQRYVTSTDQAKDIWARQITPQVAKKYNLPEQDVYKYLIEKGFIDIDSGKPIDQERYFQDKQSQATNAARLANRATVSMKGTQATLGEEAPPPDSQGDTYNLTRRDLRDMALYSQDQQKQREQNVLDYIAKGGEMPSNLQLIQQGIDPTHFHSGRYDDLQMATTKGQVNRDDINRISAQLQQSGKYNQYTAPIEAKAQKHLLTREQADKEINAENALRQEKEKSYGTAGGLTGTGFAGAKAGGLEPATGQQLQQYVNQDLSRLYQKYGSFGAVMDARKKAIDEEAARQARIKQDGWLKYIGETARSTVGGATKGALNTIGDYLQGSAVWTKPMAEGIANLLGSDWKPGKTSEHDLYKLGTWWKGLVNQIPTNKDYDQQFWGGQLGQGIGSSIGMIPAGLGGELPIALFSTLQMGGSGHEQALQAGATEEQAQKFALLNSGLFGWTETLGVGNALQRLNSGPGKKLWKELFTDALKESGEEVFLNEGPQQLGENLIAQMTYDPDRKWDNDVANSMASAGVSAPLISTAVTMLLHLRHRAQIKAQLAKDASEGGPNVRYYDEQGQLFVGGKKVDLNNVSDEMKQTLGRYTEIHDQINEGLQKIEEFKKANPRPTPAQVKELKGQMAELGILAKQQQLNASTIEQMSGVPPPDTLELQNRNDEARAAAVAKDPLLQPSVDITGRPLTPEQTQESVKDQIAQQLAPTGQAKLPEKPEGRVGVSKPPTTAETAPAETAATLPAIAPVRARGFGAKTAATEAATTEAATPAATTPEHFMTPSEIDDLMRTNELKKVPPEQLPNRAEFSNSLGIPRSEMPQIRGRDQEEFIAFAKEKGIEIKPDTVKASDLKPTQSEYNPQQAMQIPPEMIAAKRLMVSSDNRVLDGHNTLVNIQQNTPNADVEIQRIPLTAKEALKLMHSFPKTTTKSVGQVGSTDEVEGKTLKSVPVEHIGSRDEITKDSIPENTWGLFNKKAFDADPKTHEMVPLSKLKSDVNLDTDQQFVDHGEGKHPLVRAFNHMANAANEKTFERKRDPIKVTENKDGSYTVEDGHATLELAKKLGWKELPVEVVNRPTTPIKLDLPKPTKNEDGADVIKKPANLPASIEWAGVSHGTGWLDLAPRLAEMQAETLSQVMADPRKWLDAAYEKVGRKVIDADEYRSLFSEYTEDKLANAQGVHEAVSLLTKMAEAERLNELEEAWKAADPATRKTPVVLMLAGGPAAGKGSSAHQEIENADLVLDRVSSNAKKAIATLENIKSKGLNPQFILVVRDFTAQAEGNVQRQPDAGRLTPAHVAAEGTLGAMDAAANQGLWDWVEKNVDEDRRAILYNYPGKEKSAPPEVIDIEKVKEMLYNKDAGRDYSVADLRTLWKDVSHAYYEAHKTDVYQEDDAKTGKQKGQYIYDARIPAAIDGKDVPTVGSAEHLRLEGDRVPDGSDRTGRAAGVHENTAGVQGVEQGGRPEAPGPGNESDEQGSRERAKVHRVAGSEEEIQAKAGAGKQAEQGVPPPKDKPIVLILGGSLNPMHTGHADAAENARKALEDQGYTVEKIVVSPSPQTLLEKKNAGKESNAAPLATRAAIAEATVKGRKGFEVVQGPSIEAEQTTGKLKRTQLADWVASDNPGKTVINIAGEDAGVPGAPETLTEPTVYTGDPGTSHDGYYYLGMPRNMEEGMSSSKIRAEMKEGRSAPEGSMTPASEEIYQQHLEGTPLKKAVPAVPEEADTSSVDLRENPQQGKEDLGLQPGVNSVRKIGEALNQQTVDQGLVIAKDDRSDEARDRIAKSLADEVVYHLGQTSATGTGQGWYSENFPRAMDALAKIYPEFNEDKGARELFTALLAITSDGKDVEVNLKGAMAVYDQIRKGVAPTSVKFGSQRDATFKGNMRSLEGLLNEFGPKGMVNHLLEEKTVRELNAELRAMGEKPVTGYEVDMVLPKATVYFGPKLGAFFSNLMGSEGYLTMDLWWSRTFNRHRGTLVPSPTTASIDALRKLLRLPKSVSDAEIVAMTPTLQKGYEKRGYWTELERLMNRKEGTTNEQKKEFWDKAREQLTPRRFSKLERAHNIDKKANSIWKPAFKELEEAPFNSGDRTFMFKTAQEVQRQLAAQGKDLSIADIQAALWYYEKRLYSALGKKPKRTLKPGEETADDIGYEEAIHNAAASSGPRGRSTYFDRRADLRAEKVAGETGVGTQPAPAEKPEGKQLKKIKPERTAMIGIAPTRVGTIKNLRKAGQAFAEKPYRALQKLHTNLVSTLGLELSNVDRTVGAFGETSSDFEASMLPTVSGSATDVQAYAALLGTLAQDVQHSVLISSYQEGSADSEHRITFKTLEAAEDFVANRNEVGISDLSFIPATKTAILLDFGGSLDLAPFFERYGQQVENHEERNADIQFLGEADYGRVVQEARSSLSQYDSGARRAKLGALLDTAEAKLRKQGLWTDEGKSLKHVAWHGSPHQFEKFDTSKIGTGEGQQVFGHGLYFTDKEEIADYYKNTLAQGFNVSYNDLPVKDLGTTPHDQAVGMVAWSIQNSDARDIIPPEKFISGLVWSKEGQIERSKEWLADHPDDAKRQKTLDEDQATLAALKKLDPSGFKFEKNKGAKYKVDLKPTEDEYLLWDKPLSEQSDTVKKGLEELRQVYEKYDTVSKKLQDFGSFASAGELYKALSQSFGKEQGSRTDQVQTSVDLHEIAGIRGIKYFDNSSRVKGEGSYNYVVFSDKDVDIQEILKKRATQQARDQVARLQTAEATEEVLAGITGGTVHANGEVELAVHDAEAIRRLMAEREYQKTGKEIDELPFDGMVLSPAQLNGLSKFGKGLGRQQAIDAGYTDEQLKGYDKLMETLGTIGKANKGHTVAFVFDTALAHERVHKEDLDAGRVTAAGRKELKKNPAWDTKGTAFEKSYPGISEADKASELAAMIASGEAAQYGLKGTAEDHQKFLETWAKDIAENNKDNIARMGAEAWAKAFPTISALAGIQTNESSTTEQGTTEVAQEEAGTGAAPGKGSKTGGKTTAKPAAKTTTAAKTVQPTDRERADSDLFEKVKADLEKNDVSLTDEQSTGIRQQIDATSKAKEAIGSDWTASNADAVIDYFVKRKELEDHIAKLSPAKAIDVFLDVGARGSMLFAMRSLVNNIGYQGIPAVMQTVIKRLAGGTQIPGDYKWYEKIGAAIAGRWAPGRGAKAMGAHVAMAMKIYAKTGYDISRMESLDDGFKYFGEKHTHTEGPSFTESEGIKEKLNSLVRTHAKLMTPGMKWFAGGTDTLLANIHRADTSTMLAKTIATAERKAGTLKGTVADRVDFLFKDSMNPEPTTTEGAYIRESGIKDANHANFTNANVLGDALTKMRKAIPGRIGKVIYPFVKIPATATSAGLEMATGAGLVRGIGQMIKGLKMESGNEKNTQIASGIRTLLFSGGGLAIAALFCAGLLDDDDYIGAYDMDRRNKNGLSTIEGAGADMIRIGGNWYGTKWFGPIGIPLSAIMTARQGYAKGGAGTAALGYLRGVLTGALQFPGIKETSDWLTAFGRAAQAKDLAGMAKPMKATPADIGKWIASRTLTSTGVQDVYGSFIAPAIGAKLPKYDALGREAPTSPLHSFFFGAGIKPDTSNEITRELNKLYKADQMPTIGDPDSKNAKKLKESMGDARFNEFLAGLKQKFGEELGKQVESSGWMKVPPEQKKKIINSMRKAIIMAPIAAKARQPVEEPDQPTKEEERP